MFGCCVAGRLLQTNLQQVDETHALFEIPAAEKVNHICVFLLGTIPFPDGYGCTVHFFWPGKGSQVLGMLSNEKPSAIFRLRSAFSTPASGMSTPSAFTSAASSTTGEVTAILGLAIEPLETVMAQMAALPAHTINSTLNAASSSVTRPLDPTILAEKIAKHLFNYVSGFSGMQNIGPDNLVPIGLIARWYENFTSKLKTVGAGFLERLE
ncbi:DUF775-domain-containing protein [Pisolithus orientalis]|uniref:DUF775-domain-containing protein n=1 Tax=Pisolithus orientalis TaxID=936130 RepID=UPI00222504EF|nr:DUF775-domain-containing protein [Pisolithus orientalis]KAI6015074.1 DUF775-domain-containing protein [Pisolithus orientalis]